MLMLMLPSGFAMRYSCGSRSCKMANSTKRYVPLTNFQVRVLTPTRLIQQNPVYIQAVSRHQAQDQLVAASRHKLSAPNGARVAQSPSDAIFSDQDSESDVTTPPSSALPTPQHLTTEMPEVDFMEEFNYKCE